MSFLISGSAILNTALGAGLEAIAACRSPGIDDPKERPDSITYLKQAGSSPLCAKRTP